LESQVKQEKRRKNQPSPGESAARERKSGGKPAVREPERCGPVGTTKKKLKIFKFQKTFKFIQKYEILNLKFEKKIWTKKFEVKQKKRGKNQWSGAAAMQKRGQVGCVGAPVRARVGAPVGGRVRDTKKKVENFQISKKFEIFWIFQIFKFFLNFRTFFEFLKFFWFFEIFEFFLNFWNFWIFFEFMKFLNFFWISEIYLYFWSFFEFLEFFGIFFIMGDFQGVVTQGVARTSKCIFPYRGARFSKGVPPHVHAHGCTWPRRCPLLPENRPAGKKLSGSGQALAKNDPKTVQRGKTKRMQPSVGSAKRIRPSVRQKWPRRCPLLPENRPAGKKLSGSGQALGKNDPKTVQRGKTKRMQPSVGSAKRIRPSVRQKWPRRCPLLPENRPAGKKLSGSRQAVGKNDPKTFQRRKTKRMPPSVGSAKRIRPSVRQKGPENSPAGQKLSGSG
jgi:hypothetical protein